MTTDPGDLVLDPTCGSGTTAYVAEQWGRRWITADVSRVPLALARQRLLTAVFDYYELKDEAMGPAGGFVYKRKQNQKGEEVGGIVPHITLKSIANNEPPAEEVLVDRPEKLSSITRVTGPFVVEATIPTPMTLEEPEEKPGGVREDQARFEDRMVEVLRKVKTLHLPGKRKLVFKNVRVPAKTLSLSAEAVVSGEESSADELSGKTVAFVFGPENGAVSEVLVFEAAREAYAKGYAHLFVVGFGIEPNARLLVEKCSEAVGIGATYAEATRDLTMGDLLKNMRSSQVFSVCGLPDVKVVKAKDKKYQVELLGMDVFDPITMRSGIAARRRRSGLVARYRLQRPRISRLSGLFPAHRRLGEPAKSAESRIRSRGVGSFGRNGQRTLRGRRAWSHRREGDRRPRQRTDGDQGPERGRPMIQSVTIRRFKRFGELTFQLNGRHVVLAGPNNMGKTTILQAVAAWSLALTRWKDLNDFQRHGGYYTKAPIARQAFSAVPLRRYDLMWTDREYTGQMEIGVRSSEGWSVAMEFIADSTEQIFVRPSRNIDPGVLRQARLETVFVPAMTGLSKEEPLYARPETVADLLGQAKPGDVLRNVLYQASQSESAWAALTRAIDTLFGYTLLPPDASGAYIIAEYQTRSGGPRFDISSAGSGFQQVLMLLAFLNTRPATVLLLDEPDAHLHLILQDSIYSELRAAAEEKRSQLVIATHSEVIINSVEPRELMIVMQDARPLAADMDKSRLIKSLRVLSNADIMLALEAQGVLYLEGHTDLEILRAWAKVLNHPAAALLERVFWKPTVWEPRLGSEGVRAKDHYDALRLVREGLPGLVLVDGDAAPGVGSTPITGRRFAAAEMEPL